MSSLTQIEYLLERYWELAYMEGKEGRTHDDEAGNAARVLSELRALFPAAIELSPAPVQPQAEPVAWMSQNAFMLLLLGRAVEVGPRPNSDGLDLPVYFGAAPVAQAAIDAAMKDGDA